MREYPYYFISNEEDLSNMGKYFENDYDTSEMIESVNAYGFGRWYIREEMTQKGYDCEDIIFFTPLELKIVNTERRVEDLLSVQKYLNSLI